MRNYWKAIYAAAGSALVQVPLPPDAPLWIRVLAAAAAAGFATWRAPKNKPASE